jgi:LuxR family maltose regulon positive regulatory protein
VGSLCNLAGLCMLHGQLDQAQETYRQALDLAVDGRGRRLPIAAKALLGLGEIARERNDLDAATCYLTEAIERMEQYAPVGALAGYLSLSSVRQARGDVEGARHLLDKAGELAARSNATDVDDLIVAALRARLEVLHGDLGAAERWASERGWTEAALLPDL